MSNLIFDKFSKCVGWMTKEIKNTYDENIRYEQFENDLIGCSVILIDIGKNDCEIYDILHKYFGVEQMSEIKNYVSAAHKWIEYNSKDQ